MTIAVIGAGYVGLPLAIAFARRHSVFCYDISKKRIDKLKKGIDSNKQHSKKEINQTKLKFVYDSQLLQNIKTYIITVPTPINLSNHPDLTMLEQASLLVGRLLKKNSMVVYESTTYPGCTEEFCIPLLEQASQLKFGKDFFVAYSPERVNPGDKVNTLQTITKIVGANDLITLNKVKKLYETICKSIYSANSIKIAESAKVIENIQRDINIALVNELSVLFHKLNIPTNEVLKAAATKWNFHYYKPGLVGGHCIGVDPYYLAYKAERHNYFPQLILSGRRFNENMGRYIATQTVQLLSKHNIASSKAKIAVLGFSFKENIPDSRNTKIIQIIQELKNWKAKVEVFDSIVLAEEVKKEYGITVQKFQELKKQKYDAIILAVSHKEFVKNLSYYNFFYKNKNKKIIIDVKNIFKEHELIKNNYHFFQL
jgi:UDP-N-acetyl-D-glucosamine/UDP-N-acetyl-D-galactosamine dehydrogenase